MNTKESLDSRILRWSGVAIVAFLVAAFALAARADQPTAFAACPAPSTEVVQ